MPHENTENDTYGLSPNEISLIYDISERDVFEGDLSVQEKIDRINECFADGFGDIIIESDGEQYRIIEDYKEDVKEWLLKHRK
jgi:hypothetical protein